MPFSLSRLPPCRRHRISDRFRRFSSAVRFPPPPPLGCAGDVSRAGRPRRRRDEIYDRRPGTSPTVYRVCGHLLARQYRPDGDVLLLQQMRVCARGRHGTDEQTVLGDVPPTGAPGHDRVTRVRTTTFVRLDAAKVTSRRHIEIRLGRNYLCTFFSRRETIFFPARWTFVRDDRHKSPVKRRDANASVLAPRPRNSITYRRL